MTLKQKHIINILFFQNGVWKYERVQRDESQKTTVIHAQEQSQYWCDYTSVLGSGMWAAIQEQPPHPLLNRPELEQSIGGWDWRGGFQHEMTTGMFHAPQN